MLDDRLAERVPDSTGVYCVTLDTVDDRFIEQREQVIVEFCAGCDAGIVGAPENIQCPLMIEDDDGGLLYRDFQLHAFEMTC